MMKLLSPLFLTIFMVETVKSQDLSTVAIHGFDLVNKTFVSSSEPKSYFEELVGKTVKVLLPISVKGVINEYTYIFRIDWIWTYPELR